MVLTRFGLLRSSYGLAWQISSSDSRSPEDTLDSSTSQTHAIAIALFHMPSQTSTSTSCLRSAGVGWGTIRTISRNWEKICNYWVELATVPPQSEGRFRKLPSKLRFWTSTIPLGLEVTVRQAKVGFCSVGSSHGTFCVNFSQLEAQNVDPYRFYCLKWGCDNLFPEEFNMRFVWYTDMKILNHGNLI